MQKQKMKSNSTASKIKKTTEGDPVGLQIEVKCKV